MNQNFFISSQKLPISLIPAHSCILQTQASKSPTLTTQEILSQAYASKLLKLESSYFVYSFYQELTHEYLHFFTPCTPSSSIPCTLDLLIPLSLYQENLACIFLSKEKNYFCFYQESKLVFYREFQEEITTCLQHIQIFFSHQIDKIYCLSYDSSTLGALQTKHTLIPLLSLFDHQAGFHLSSITHPIKLKSFHNLNTQTPKNKISQTKKLSIFLGIPLFILISLFAGTQIYQTHLQNKLNALNQNLSSQSFSSPIDELTFLNSQNQILLSSLYEFSLLEEQKLLILSRLFSYLNPQDILSIKFDNAIILKLKNAPDLALLFSFSSALGYRCRTYKEGDHTTLEITKL